MNRAELGRIGERCAEWYYRSHGYRILARNFRVRGGELDLVARRGKTVVFAEVKTRSSCERSQPCEAVGTAKQRRVILAAQSYMTRFSDDPFFRFDVVEVYADSFPFRVRCIKDAFQLE